MWCGTAMLETEPTVTCENVCTDVTEAVIKGKRYAGELPGVCTFMCSMFEHAWDEAVCGCVTTFVNTNYFESELTTTGCNPWAKTNVNTGNLVAMSLTVEEAEKSARVTCRGGDIATDSSIGKYTYEMCERTSCNLLALTGMALTH